MPRYHIPSYDGGFVKMSNLMIATETPQIMEKKCLDDEEEEELTDTKSSNS